MAAILSKLQRFHISYPDFIGHVPDVPVKCLLLLHSFPLSLHRLLQWLTQTRDLRVLAVHSVARSLQLTLQLRDLWAQRELGRVQEVTTTVQLRLVASCLLLQMEEPGPWFNKNVSSYQYRKSHCGDKTVVRSSYLHNRISYTVKMSSLYWIRALVLIFHPFMPQLI